MGIEKEVLVKVKATLDRSSGQTFGDLSKQAREASREVERTGKAVATLNRNTQGGVIADMIRRQEAGAGRPEPVNRRLRAEAAACQPARARVDSPWVQGGPDRCRGQAAGRRAGPWGRRRRPGAGRCPGGRR